MNDVSMLSVFGNNRIQNIRECAKGTQIWYRISADLLKFKLNGLTQDTFIFKIANLKSGQTHRSLCKTSWASKFQHLPVSKITQIASITKEKFQQIQISLNDPSRDY